MKFMGRLEKIGFGCGRQWECEMRMMGLETNRGGGVVEEQEHWGLEVRATESGCRSILHTVRLVELPKAQNVATILDTNVAA